MGHADACAEMSWDRRCQTHLWSSLKIRCVIAIRGPIRTIKCDQGSNFRGAALELKVAIAENLEEDVIKWFLLSQNCEFAFNRSYYRHMGCIWERCIHMVHSVLITMLWQHHSKIDSTSLRTFFYEVMSLVNGRPLTLQNMTDSDSPVALTQNHLHTFKSNVVVPPPGSFNRDDVYGLKRWRRVQGLTNVFWQRWRQEYVLNLQIRQKWLKSKRKTVGSLFV